MVNADWKIAKSTFVCSSCASKFKAAQSYVSVLFDRVEGFERQDFCAVCFQEKPPAHVFSFWKAVVPDADENEAPRPVLDVASVLDFFRRLEGEREPQKAAFRYVLALMLTRKKVLRLQGGGKGSAGPDVLVFTEGRGGERHEVVQPPLDESEIAAVSEELGRLLGLRPAPAKQAPAQGVAATDNAAGAEQAVDKSMA